MDKKILKIEDWVALHSCFLDGKSALNTIVLRDKEVFLELSKIVTIGENDRGISKIVLRDKEGLKQLLLVGTNFFLEESRPTEFLSEICG